VEVRDARFEGSEHHHYVLRMGRFPAARVRRASAVGNGANELRLPEVRNARCFSRIGGQFSCLAPFTAALRRADDEGSTWLPLTTTELPVAIARETRRGARAGPALSVSPAATLAFNLSPMRANPFLTLDALLLTGRAQARCEGPRASSAAF